MDRVKEDVSRFIPNRENITIWSPTYFHDLSAKLKLDADEAHLPSPSNPSDSRR